MKIVYLIAGTYRPAGMERVLALKADHFASRGDDVLVVTTDQRGREPAFGFAPSVRTVDLGVDYELTNGRNFLVKALAYPFKKAAHRRRLSALLKEEKADVVVSMFCNDASFVPRIKDGSRKVLEIHFSRFKLMQYGRTGLWAIADRIRSRNLGRIASRYDRFVVLTQEDRDYWLADFPALEGRICVIPNPRTFGPEDIPAGRHGKMVLAAGRCCGQKNFGDLVRAWSLVPAGVRDGWTLRIAGDGPLRPELEKMAPEAGNVVIGPAADMKDEYAAASVFALTSRYEGLPMVLLEAQAAGLPIVSYECKCGPKDVVSDGVDGFLVPEGDVAGIAARLQALMTDDALSDRMSAAASGSSARFAADKVLPQWDALLAPPQRTVVVSAVNLRKGGTLEILRQTLRYLSAQEDLRVVALVHRRELCDYPGIEYVEMPGCIKSWGRRLWAEYVTMHRISLELAAQRGGVPVDVWLSLHDTTPRVVAKKREVYCHTSFPFLKTKAKDFIMDPKIPLFAIMGKFAYRIGAHANDSIIVQQEWFADAMSSLLKVPRERFRVIPPVFAGMPEAPAEVVKPEVPTFLFVSTPDCHKNFETLLEASRLLENQLGAGRFRTVITVKGDENRYARWLYGKWGCVDSVRFAGRVPHDELCALYGASDVFVFPSRIETWGLPISEYMAANPDGRLLLADLPYAHETARGASRADYFKPDDVQALKRLMHESIAAR